MLQNQFKSQELMDGIGPMTGGMNADLSPLILPKDQLSFATNLTTRRSYIHPRPPFQIRKLDAAAKTLIASALTGGTFQGAAFYNPDVGDESIVASIAGRLFKFNVLQSPVTVDEISIPGDLNPASQDQVWMWQAEKWLIVNDGVSVPIFYDGTTSFRSSYSTTSNFSTFTTAAFVVPNVGAVVAGVTVNDSSNILVGDILTFKNFGTFLVQTSPGGGVVDLVNLTAQANQTIPSATDLFLNIFAEFEAVLVPKSIPLASVSEKLVLPFPVSFASKNDDPLKLANKSLNLAPPLLPISIIESAAPPLVWQ